MTSVKFNLGFQGQLYLVSSSPCKEENSRVLQTLISLVANKGSS